MHAVPTRRKMLVTTGALLALGALVTGCSSEAGSGNAQPTNATVEGNEEEGETVVIGFSGPAADHGWLGAINSAAIAEADKFGDIEFRVAEGTNDANLQISQVEGFINDEVDAIVLLPTDGAALTSVATRAMEAGIPVVNVDREFSHPAAARTTILGDNYGMGRSAGEYICERLGDDPDAVVAEVAGIDSLPLTQDRSEGFKDALDTCGLDVDNRVAADFTVQGGESATSQLLSAAPEIDALWNHDDDQGIGVLSAIDNAGRDEFFMVGGGGSANAMREIQSGESVLEATVVYPSTQAADGVKLARLIAQGKAMSDLVEVEVPKRIVLNAPVVTSENVEEYLPTAFES
ncbi:substrate-binding domain-containing protein [Citricoccus sp. GCM10030269]|uniref:substrate-binding domain-containing protein n=1 Tax=Citricoccus sp. GCM10030269 TaxID=3273388 RepID=UPI00361FD644